jgi:GntR family transcriptional repressor for pyruvate dehydrogenase complex
MYATIRSSRLYEQITEQIQSRIMAGQLRPGDRLPPERELAGLFGVSRTAVREAVKALHEKGLLEVQPGKGTFISNITDSTSEVMRDSLDLIVNVGLENGLVDLVQVRALLEPGIAAVAAEMASTEDIQAMQKAVETMDTALDDADVYVEADLDFHRALAKATQNSLITILLDPIVDLLREQRKRVFLVEGGPERGQYHHKRILEAVATRNPVAAREAMSVHLKQVLDDSNTAPDVGDSLSSQM